MLCRLLLLLKVLKLHELLELLLLIQGPSHTGCTCHVANEWFTRTVQDASGTYKKIYKSYESELSSSARSSSAAACISQPTRISDQSFLIECHMAVSHLFG